METGGPGQHLVHAAKPVEVEPKRELACATTLLQLMEEHHVLDQDLRPNLATLRRVQLHQV